MRRLLPILLTVAVLLGSVGASASDHCEESSNPRYVPSECGFLSGYGEFWKGFEAYRKEDYATALSVFEHLANSGDARAQNKLGSLKVVIIVVNWF